MSFANPLGFLGLLSLPVIAALHLLLERRRRIVVSDIGLWSFLKRESRGNKPRRLPLTWLLVLDLFIATLLCLAWTQPQIIVASSWPKARHVILLMDLSTSMKAEDLLPSRFTKAVLDANALLGGLGPRDVATVITFGRQAHWIGDSRQDDFQSLVAKLNKLQPGETGHSLEQTLALGLSAIDRSLPVEFHIFTDGAFNEIPIDTLEYPIHWHEYGKSTDNQAVFDISATPVGDSSLQVFARFANFGDESASRVVAFLIDGVPVDSNPVQIPPDSAILKAWTVPQGAQVATVSLLGGDTLPADDSASIGLQSSSKVDVTLVANEPEPLKKAIESVPDTELRLVSPQDYSSARVTDLTIFRDWLPEQWPPGQIFVVDPPTGENITTLNLPVIQGEQIIPADELTQADGSDPLLNGINWDSVRWERAVGISQLPGSLKPIVQAGNTPVILSGSVITNSVNNSGMVILLADLQSGNFSQDPAFPIFVYNLVKRVRPAPLAAQIQSGENLLLPPKGNYRTLSVNLPNSDTFNYQMDWPVYWQTTKDPGVYQFELEDLYGKKHTFMLGVNAGDFDEADLRPREWINNPNPQIDQAGNLSSDLEMENQLDLMPWLLAIALLALFLEASLAWRK